MTVAELVQRFPEIPPDLHHEPAMTAFAETFDAWLTAARKPSACAEAHTPENKRYLKLVGPMDIYRYGLSTREQVIAQLDGMLAAYREDAAAFETEMLTGKRG